MDLIPPSTFFNKLGFYHIKNLSLTQLIVGPSKGLCMRSKDVGFWDNGVKTKTTRAVTKT